jgi:hypothetical protein
MRPLSRTPEEIARYYAADNFRDRREYIRGCPNYVGGREEWIERSLHLREAEEIRQALAERT